MAVKTRSPFETRRLSSRRNKPAGIRLNLGSIAELRCVLGSAFRRADRTEGSQKLATLRDAITHLAKLIPQAERNMPEI
jgi:hypothetical protein